METAIAKSLKLVIEKVNVALKNSTKTTKCTIVGASKTKPLAVLQEAYDAGLRHFGENYVDEIVTKAPQVGIKLTMNTKLPQDIKWHYIGHLQSNKIKQVLVPNLYMLETLDSIKQDFRIQIAFAQFEVTQNKISLIHGKEATKVQKECQKISKKLKVLIQVKTSTEDTKSGVSQEDVPDLVEFIMTQCPNLEFSGLMTIGYEGDENAFTQLYDVKVHICEKFKLNKEDVELSMGMSQDYEKAILFGSSNVRIGTTIFGAREYPMKAMSKEEHIAVGETAEKPKPAEEKTTEGKKDEEESKV